MDDNYVQRGRTLRRGKTLIRPERSQAPEPMLNGGKEKSNLDAWVIFSWIVTFWAPSFILKRVGLPMPDMVQAWREKFALCFIIFCICGVVVFITFFLPTVFCSFETREEVGKNLRAISNKDHTLLKDRGYYIIDEFVFGGENPKVPNSFPLVVEDLEQIPDISSYFRKRPGYDSECLSYRNSKGYIFNAVEMDPCNVNNGNGGCIFDPIQEVYIEFGLDPEKGKNKEALVKAGYAWHDIHSNFFAIDKKVLNFNTYLSTYPEPIRNDPMDAAIRKAIRLKLKDATRLFYRDKDLFNAIPCLKAKYSSGTLQSATAGCFGTDFFMSVSLIVVLSIILIRFTMAFVFHWFISHRLSRKPSSNSYRSMMVVKDQPWGDSTMARKNSNDPNELYTILLVTCYSEGELSIRTTVDSLASTDYSDDKKMLFIVADGIITGSGNDKSTPDICIDMIEIDPNFANPEPQSYIAVAAGSKQHNRATVYAGHYLYKGRRIPTLLVIKSGNPQEVGKPKAGNRGKRDSQLILMTFFSRVIYNERMTPLDYDMFTKIHHLMGVTPDHFETVLMVDADTKVYPDSVKLLTYCLINDPLIMGLCGETKIANKRDSWVTAIQVFEYYISHHLGKGFESVFGGVTCLPGCFCMYRLKAPKGDNEWVPIITKPEIVQEYSQNIVETLHQKNLLLLGEDRFLTTLMLRNFPNRKMMFMPQAVCKTVVPDEFSVLLSQRRRWINSTIHNLLELVLVRNLCGTFCFSMQFVIFMELIGTVVLPVAVVMTFVLIVSIAKVKVTLATCLPLVMLLLVLFSPALLIMITTRKLIYVAWMSVYLLALPIWNFVLPVYSYWHFDDFSWGATRMVEGEAKGDSHGKKEGEFDASEVSLRRWEEYERRARRFVRRKERQTQRASEMNFSNRKEESEGRLLGNDDHYYEDDNASGRSGSLDMEIGPEQRSYNYGSGVGRAIGDSYDRNSNYGHANYENYGNSSGDSGPKYHPVGPRPYE